MNRHVERHASWRISLISSSLLVALASTACIKTESPEDQGADPFEMSGIGHDAAATVDNEILFAGSEYTSDATLEYDDRVDVYNVRSRTWRIDSLSRPRAYIKTATIGSKAYFISGLERVSGPPGHWVLGASNAIEMYDGATGLWSSDTLSVARTGPAVAVVGSKLIVAGGFNQQTPSGFLNSIEVIDTVTNQRSSATLSVPRTHFGAAAIGTKVYFPGGMGHSLLNNPSNSLNSMEVLDIATGIMAVVNMPHGCRGCVAVASDGKVFIAGGTDTQGPTSFLDIYTPSTGAWTSLSIRAHGEGLKTTTVGPYVAFIGGYSNPKALTLIDSKTNSLYDEGTFNYGRYNHGAAPMNNRIFVGGGIGSDGPSQTVEVLDLQKQTISTLLSSEN